jgi:hypothetical protein
MAYKPVTRVVTIEFTPEAGRGPRQQIDVTPEHLEVRSGDTIVWKVQGVPQSATVSVGNFTHWGTPMKVTFRRGKVTIGKPSLLRDDLLKQKGKDWTIDTARCELGPYKYDVILNEKTVLDPDVEIKGPKGR